MAWTSSSLLRSNLKSKLCSERIEFTGEGFHVVCAYCGEPVIGAPDMHEALITRGNIRHSEELKLLIYVRENCVLVHHGKCHENATTEAGRRKCIKNLLRYNKLRDIITWLDNFGERTKSALAEERIILVTEVFNELYSL